MINGEIVLGGGGDAEEDYKVLKYFSRDVKKLLYIPVALNQERYPDCYRWCKNHFKKFNVIDITMLTDLSSEVNLDNFDAVYIGGGNTYKLLKEIKENNFFQKLKKYYDRGGKIGGGSAGSIIFGDNILIADLCSDPDQNLVNLQNLKGFNLCKGYDILPHYFLSQEQEIKNYVKDEGRKVIGIPDDSSIIISNGEIRVYGESSCYIVDKEKSIELSGRL